MKKNGFTALEVIVAITIIAIISVGIGQVLTVVLSTFNFASKEVQNAGKAQLELVPLETQLQNTKTFVNISPNEDPNGVLQYIDDDNVTVNIYYNTAINRSTLGENSYPTESVMVTYEVGGNYTEVLMDDVEAFYLVAYTYDDTESNAITINNQLSPPNSEDIASLKFIIHKIQPDGSIKVIQKLKHLKSNLISSLSGNIDFGDNYDGNAYFPFAPFLGYTGFTTENVDITIDNGTVLQADGLHLSPKNHVAKILNTGLYYSTIQGAIDDSQPSHIILVAGGYHVETLTLRSDILIVGGFTPTDWSFDPDNEITMIDSIATNKNDITLTAADRAQVRNFVILANDAGTAVKVENMDMFTLKDCAIQSAAVGVTVNNAQIDIINSVVTSNEEALIVINATPNIIRSQFNSLNTNTNNTVYLKNVSAANIVNNIIRTGENGILIDNSQEVSLINNVIGHVPGNAITAINDSNVSIINNAIIDHNVGVSANNSVTNIFYNLIADYAASPTSGTAALGAGNILDPEDYEWGEDDTYFINNIYYLNLGGDGANLVDTGEPAIPDAYINPGIGTLAGDIGLYGGPNHGRVGPATIRFLNPGDSVAQINEIFDETWPGDAVQLNPGTYTDFPTIALKNDTVVFGKKLDTTTVINDNDNDECFNAANNAFFFNFEIDGNGKEGINIDNTSNSSFLNMIFRDCTTALRYNNGSISLVFQNTFENNSTDIHVESDFGFIDAKFNIFANSTIAIDNEAAATVFSYYSYFSNIGTPTVGSVIEDPIVRITPQSPLFVDVDNHNYYLHPSSNAINIINGQDIGAFEHHISTGSATSPPISLSDTKFRKYQSLGLTLFGDPLEIPANLNGKNTEVSIYYILKNQTGLLVTQNITGNSHINLEFPLPENIYAHDIQLKAILKSYQYNNTPYINKLRLEW